MLITDVDPQIKADFMRALEFYGVERQHQVAVGECGEFLTEIGRRAQGRSTPEGFIDEIVDVLIMMNKLALIYGEDKVKERIRTKLTKININLARDSAVSAELNKGNCNGLSS